MQINWQKIFLQLCVINLLLPYFYILFITKSQGLILERLIPFLSVLLSFVLLTFIIRSKRNKPIKTVFSVVTVLSTIFYFSFREKLFVLSDYFFLTDRMETLNSLVTEVKNYQKTTGDSGIIFIDTKQSNIPQEITNQFRSKLKLLQLKGMKAEGNNISFSLGGSVGSSKGISYIEDKNFPVSGEWGQYTMWRQITGKWFSWYTS